ncbi:hypothetical protein IFR05_007043 [Cadophora sp. M221]|nr:hypothetical protein IFR05_007043 [Cadophora sp. M221]
MGSTKTRGSGGSGAGGEKGGEDNKGGEKKGGGNKSGGGSGKLKTGLLPTPRPHGARDRMVAHTKKVMMSSAAYVAASEGERAKMLKEEKKRVRALPEYSNPYSNTRTPDTRDSEYRNNGGIIGKKGKGNNGGDMGGKTRGGGRTLVVAVAIAGEGRGSVAGGSFGGMTAGVDVGVASARGDDGFGDPNDGEEGSSVNSLDEVLTETPEKANARLRAIERRYVTRRQSEKK